MPALTDIKVASDRDGTKRLGVRINSGAAGLVDFDYFDDLSMHDCYRYALGIAYCGSNYFGWQKQPSQTGVTIQSCLETAISKVAARPVQTFCAGRTDKGVHATAQVVHFDTSNSRPLKAWVLGVNGYLPPNIRVMWAEEVSSSFHARFSAINRQYRYTVYNDPIASAHLYSLTAWVRPQLDVELMRIGSRYLCGKHDFSSFRSRGCQASSPIRDLHYLRISQQGPCIYFDLQANSFLYHMVRNIVGALIQVGRKRQSPEWIREVLVARDCCASQYMAPASGLCLSGVSYSALFKLPETPGHYLGHMFSDSM